MIKFSPIRGTTTQINNTPIIDGQILFETNNADGANHIYMDVGSQRIGVGIFNWVQIQNKPFNSIGSGLSVSDGVLSANNQSWTQITGKPFNSIGTGLVVRNNTLELDTSVIAWNNLANKPFSTIGNGLTVDSNNRLNANVLSVDVSSQGSAGTASSVTYQKISVNTNGTTVNTEIKGTKYMEYSQTLSTTANTVYTFNSSEITTSSAIDLFTSISGITPIDVNVTTGRCTVTFEPYTVANTNMTCRIYIK